MKRTFIAFLVLMASLTASAYTCVTFNSGDPSVLMKKATITYEIDWDHARVTNYDNLLFPQYLKKRGNDFVRDWPKDRQRAEKYFTTRFNKKSDYLQISEKGKGGEYKLTLRIATIDVGNGGSNFNPWASAKAGGCIIDGTIEISNPQGQVLCVLNVVEAKGTGVPSETVRYGMVLSEIAGDIWDFVDDEVEEGHVQATAVAATAAAAAPVAAATTATAAKTTASSAKTSASSAKTTASSAKTSASSAKATASSAKTAASSAKTSASSAARSETPAGATNLGEARVTLKNGSVIIGKVKAFDPTTSITLFVAGLTTTIQMSEVANVESLGGGSLGSGATSAGGPVSVQVAEGGASLGNRKIAVTDEAQYPSSFNLNIGGQQLHMVLVRGGRMNMGYDGSGSRKMMSEPIHEVAVTSFYISDQPIPVTVASQLVKDVEGRSGEPAQFREFREAQQLVNAIARQAGKPYRMPTEAEWEYAASGDQQNAIFNLSSNKYVYYEWTSDFHDDFPDDGRVLVDPTGPAGGDEHQVRSYNGDRGKYDRSNKIDEDDAYLGLVRLVIKAKDSGLSK